MSHELLPKLQDELRSLRSRIEREKTAMSQAAHDPSALDATRRRLTTLTNELEKLEHTERMFIEQSHGS